MALILGRSPSILAGHAFLNGGIASAFAFDRDPLVAAMAKTRQLKKQFVKQMLIRVVVNFSRRLRAATFTSSTAPLHY